MKISKKKIIKEASIAYKLKIKPLIHLEEININEIIPVVKQLVYQITGNEDVMCEEKYDKEFKRLLTNFEDVFHKVQYESGVMELFEEIDNSKFTGEKITEEDKEIFLEMLKDNKRKLKIINMVLGTLFVTICFKSAGYKINL